MITSYKGGTGNSCSPRTMTLRQAISQNSLVGISRGYFVLNLPFA